MLQLMPSVSTDHLIPAQGYVLNDNVDTIMKLYWEFMEHDIDIFHLTGALLFYVERNGVEEGPIPFLPPIVEVSREPDGRTLCLINDGMHRISAARRINSNINIILASGVPQEYPYYAHPLEGGWSSVEELDYIPEGYQKKKYRDPERYKDLFRMFNEVFEGIQKSRPTITPVT